MPREPRRTCTYTKGGVRCKQPRVVGRKWCAQHGATKVSKDPVKRERQYSGLAKRSGNRHTVTTKRLDPKVIAEHAEALAEQVPYRNDAGEVPPGLMKVVENAAKREVAADELDALDYLTVRQEQRRSELEKSLAKDYDALGLSVRAIMDYEPLRRRQQAAKLHVARPNQSPEHQMKMLQALVASGQIEGCLWVGTRDQPLPKHPGNIIVFVDERSRPTDIDAADNVVELPSGDK